MNNKWICKQKQSKFSSLSILSAVKCTVHDHICSGRILKSLGLGILALASKVQAFALRVESLALRFWPWLHQCMLVVSRLSALFAFFRMTTLKHCSIVSAESVDWGMTPGFTQNPEIPDRLHKIFLNLKLGCEKNDVNLWLLKPRFRRCKKTQVLNNISQWLPRSNSSQILHE